MDVSRIYLSTAFILGMLHTLEPGHGKSVIAAYLVGVRGGTAEAVLLGLITAFTHTFSVIVLGLLFKFVSERVFAGAVQTSFKLAAGAMILAVGLWVLWGGLRRSHVHVHPHPHPHPHPHHPGERSGRYRLPQIALMGLSAGMIPCPAGIAVLLSSISSGQIDRGLTLVLVFSLGVAFAITSIAVIAANVARAAEMLMRERLSGLFERLPVVSGAIISALGIYSIVRVFA